MYWYYISDAAIRKTVEKKKGGVAKREEKVIVDCLHQLLIQY